MFATSTRLLETLRPYPSVRRFLSTIKKLPDEDIQRYCLFRAVCDVYEVPLAEFIDGCLVDVLRTFLTNIASAPPVATDPEEALNSSIAHECGIATEVVHMYACLFESMLAARPPRYPMVVYEAAENLVPSALPDDLYRSLRSRLGLNASAESTTLLARAFAYCLADFGDAVKRGMGFINVIFDEYRPASEGSIARAAEAASALHVRMILSLALYLPASWYLGDGTVCTSPSLSSSSSSSSSDEGDDDLSEGRRLAVDVVALPVGSTSGGHHSADVTR